MIHAVYRDGHKYCCGNLWGVDLKRFVVDDLVALQVGRFVLDKDTHGYPLFHCLRTCLTGSGRAYGRMYVLCCDRLKVFVDHNGYFVTRSDWSTTDAKFSEPKASVIRPAWTLFGPSGEAWQPGA